MAPQTETLRIRIDADLRRVIEAYAERAGLTISAAVRHMLVGYCAGRSAPSSDGDE